jgi:hypothetical protein
MSPVARQQRPIIFAPGLSAVDFMCSQIFNADKVPFWGLKHQRSVNLPWHRQHGLTEFFSYAFAALSVGVVNNHLHI